MTLFAGGLSTGSSSESKTHRTRRRVGWTALIAALLGTVLLALLPSPYVIERPGPVFDTLGSVEISGTSTPMISVSGQKTWPTVGSLDLLTVSLLGDPQHLPNWLDIAAAWLDPTQAVLPLDAVYPPGYSVQDSAKQGSADMQNSKKDAIAAALRSLGYTVPAVVKVAELTPKSPSRGFLKGGDEIVSIGGSPIDSITELRSVIAKNGTDAPLDIVVSRNGKTQSVAVTPSLSAGASPTPVLGIYAGVNYDYPFDVKIQLDNVGGPSAGQMFALGIIDKLTPGSLAGGKHVAGTGTIDDKGVIGPIGGIRQKMYGAQRAGATVFLAPYGDCDEVVGHIPQGLTVFAVKTLQDSLADLKVVAADGDTSGLRTCEAG